MVFATWFIGWWGVAVVAVAAAYVLRATPAITWRIALAAAEGWAFILVIDALIGPLSTAALMLGSIMSIPGPALLGVTLLYPALVAWSAASVTVNLFSRGPNPPSNG